MLKTFIERENDIFNILGKLKDAGIKFVLIGGYAVSAYKHRFSVDADIVVKEEQLKEIKQVLEKSGFEPYKSLNLQNAYKGKFRAFIKKTELPITVDLLVNAVSSRQTNASWSFGLFSDNSIEKEIKGIEKSIRVLIPIKELIIATKIHACRLTDIRDIVAICDNTDPQKILEFSKRGELHKLSECIKRFKETIQNKNFIDAFKGAFSVEKLPSESLKHSEEIMTRIEESINEP